MSTATGTAAPLAAPPRAHPVVRAAGWFVASLVAIAVVAGLRWDLDRFWIPFLVLVVSAYRLDRAIHDVVAAGDRRPSWRRAGLAAATLVVALVVGAAGWFQASFEVGTRVVHLGGLFFVGTALGVVAAAGLLSEARMFAKTHRAPIVGCFAVAVVAGVVAATRARADGWWVAGVLVAVVAGEVGTELLSERGTTWELTPGRRRLASRLGLGLVVVVVLVAGVLWHLPAAQGLGLLAVLLVASWMASSDNDAVFVVVPVVAAALLWASAPRSPTFEERERAVRHDVLGDRSQPGPAPVVDGEPYFLVLGDSYTSGEGATAYLAGTNTLEPDPDRHDNQCRQAPTAWPWLLAEAHPGSVPDRLLFEACSGGVAENIATTRDVVLADGRTRRVGGTAQLDLARADISARRLGRPAFIVLGVGGNDAGFSRLGTTCIGPGKCSELATAFTRSARPDDGTVGADDLGPSELENIGDDLHRAYLNVAAAFPGVPVVVTAYPQPVSIGSPCATVLLDNDERLFIKEFVAALNALVEAEAAEHGFHFLGDLEGSLRDRNLQLCDPANPGGAGLNFVGLNPTAGTTRDALDPTRWTHNSLHPNERGHRAMAEAAIRWFEAHPVLSAPGPPPDRHRWPEVQEQRQEAATDQCRSSNPKRCTIDGDGWFSHEIADAYRRAIVPLALIMVGWWLFLLAFGPWLPRWLRARWNQQPA